jgi:hypothetical protein
VIEIVGIDHVQLSMPIGGEDEARAFYGGLPIRRCYVDDPFGNRIELVDGRDGGFSEG